MSQHIAAGVAEAVACKKTSVQSCVATCMDPFVFRCGVFRYMYGVSLLAHAHAHAHSENLLYVNRLYVNRHYVDRQNLNRHYVEIVFMFSESSLRGTAT